ncbi:PAS domain S-box protein [Paraburkholderia aromaticivorans]|uniref:PAS domain S-box protein n=1 Tax=Paraburkholderia aromaticivorans TaxID=2026199 RepID=UPI001455FE9D|nr:PAS domain S-box protein [Paraburkholderia aromaticivorans]
MVIHDMDTGEILEANRKACEMYGHPIEELRGMSIGELTRNHFPYDTEGGLRRVREARDSGDSVIFEWVIRHANDQETPVEVSLKRITLNGIDRVIAVARDITERKQAVAQLKERERYYRRLIESSSDGIAILSAAGMIRFVGPSIYALLGVSARVLTGRSVYAFIAPDNVESVREAIHSLAPGASVNLAYRIQHRNGGWRIHEARCRNLLDDRAVNGILVNFRDVTERVKAEETARARALELSRIARISTTGEMATALAHELNQPLFAIVNFVAGCRRRIGSGNYSAEDLMRVLELTQNEAERAGRIINKVREFTCNRTYRRQTVDVRKLIHDISDLIALRARQDDVTVHYEMDDTPCEIECDDVLIQQVVINLAINGIEAMSGSSSDQRELRISASKRPDGDVQITVSDTGPGLPRVSPERIFASLFSTKHAGLGIGLSLCHSIVETHGGRLWVASSDVPPRTRFHVMLPRTLADAPPR